MYMHFDNWPPNGGSTKVKTILPMSLPESQELAKNLKKKNHADTIISNEKLSHL